MEKLLKNFEIVWNRSFIKWKWNRDKNICFIKNIYIGISFKNVLFNNEDVI